ncbi:MAG TPA: sugar MFS transporter [Polyangiaceae bacterium]|jgi:FHS family L-fucose permease-like MFS transporter
MALIPDTSSAPVAATSVSSATSENHRAAAGVLMALFFAIGFLTCLNDIIIPHFKAIFDLDYTRAMLIQFSFFTAYFVVSPPAGFAIRRFGYKRGILLGLLVAATGCFGFYPAASFRSYPMFLAALFVLASGFTLLQVAANPYVAILGKPETASSRLTLTQAFNSLGTTLAPLFGSALILRPSTNGAPVDPAEASQSVTGPYLALGATLVLMSVALTLFRLPESKAEGNKGSGGLLSHAPLVFGCVAIFVYVGAEVSIGSILVSFLKEPSAGAMSAETAAKCISFYWGGAMIGRFAGSAILRTWSPPRVLGVFAAAALTLVLATVLLRGNPAVVTILSVGLFNSIMFPTIFTLAIDGLGDRTGEGSGALCMAIVGGALVPVLEGAVADRAGLHLAFLVPAVCYAYIAWYALVGSKARFASAAATEIVKG